MIWCVEDDAHPRYRGICPRNRPALRPRALKMVPRSGEALHGRHPEACRADDAPRHRRDGAAAPHARGRGAFRYPCRHGGGQGAEYDKIRGLDQCRLLSDKAIRRDGAHLLCQSSAAPLWYVSASQLRCGGLVLDEESHTVTADGESVALTYKEFELLRLFLSHPGTAFRATSSWRTCGARTTRGRDARWTYIRTLRQKLGAYAARRSRPCAAWATGWRSKA